jgi:hypothetical protein
LLTLGQIAGHLGVAAQLAVGIVQSRQHGVRPEVSVGEAKAAPLGG